jgi:uncharacterized membrane protein
MTNRLLRLLNHRRLDEADARRLVGSQALSHIAARVAASEKHHTGQIRVCIEAGLPLSYLRRNAPVRERAMMMFGKLRVWDTEHNNGVLIYVLLAERAIEMVADRGVARRVDTSGWQTIAASMSAAFGQGQFEAGLNQAIDAIDALLTRYFPLAAGQINVNELPDAPDVR